MQRAPQITFRHMESSPVLEKCVQDAIRKLEWHDRHITGCHVVIDAPHGHALSYRVTVELALPGDTIVVGSIEDASGGHANPHLAVMDSFRLALRALEDRQELARLRSRHGRGVSS